MGVMSLAWAQYWACSKHGASPGRQSQQAQVSPGITSSGFDAWLVLERGLFGQFLVILSLGLSPHGCDFGQ